MKSLKSKLILLMMAVPLLLIFTTSSVVKVTTILVDIPVSRIEILGESTLFVDLAAANNRVQIRTAIYPENATNKNVSFSYEEIEGETPAEVIIADDGTVIPLSAGAVRIVATADGGRSASVRINYYSSKALGAVALTPSLNILEGRSYKMERGRDFSVIPDTANYNISWLSQNPTVATVGEFSGLITAGMAGNTVIVAQIEGVTINQTTGTTSPFSHIMEFPLAVAASTNEVGISFGGEVTATKPTLDSTTFDFRFEPDKTGNSFTLEYDDTLFSSVSLEITPDSNSGRITATLNGAVDLGTECEIQVYSSQGTLLTSVYVIKEIMSRATIDIEQSLKLSNQAVIFGLSSDAPDGVGYTVSFTSSNSSVLRIQVSGNRGYAWTGETGTAIVSATVRAADGRIIDIEIPSVTVTVYSQFASLQFSDDTDFGLERELAIGKYNIASSERVETGFTLPSIRAIFLGREETLSHDDERLIWKSSDTDVATVANGVLTFGNKSGVITITAESAANQALGESVRAIFRINCRADGVNVQTYDELKLASLMGWVTVLGQDIYLADFLADENANYRNVDAYTTKMETSANNSYYLNVGHPEDSYVRYGIEFTNDVFGNGHFINGEHITRTVYLKHGYRVFNGPLDLVKLKYGNISQQNASVKAQDNIVFLVRGDGISLTNVELKGCSDSALASGNMSELNYCGTVLEVMGDDFSMTYSRVNNGRTVLRVFGRAAAKDIAGNLSDAGISNNPSRYRISAEIANSILSYGREFILKVGSNQTKKNPSVQGTQFLNTQSFLPSAYKELYDDAAPYFLRADGTEYLPQAARDDYFYQNYIMTDLTLRDVAFSNAGLFAVGMESTFAGLCLHGWDYSDTYRFGTSLGWGNVAGTSYPAVIRMEGDVRFYDWKRVSDVNSETLIEGDPQILNTVGLNLDLGTLITSYTGADADRLIVTSQGESYVNGAIAYYGGGKNYSYVDTSGVSSAFNALSSFSVPLSALGSRATLIYYSAGAEPFRFLLYDRDSGLSLARQQADISDNSAYSWVARKQ